ncbi:hypothetical protein NDU88_003292 [Pleurodeles waltl]|uniref:Uncharacterized protein n=1 Tax=Pleurodeles waltl TaxID=8319 RepID=A0AAV7KY18_PLEWA|nr:hypothetical protein NDU88_003292 [Pleurodeles waltl]
MVGDWRAWKGRRSEVWAEAWADPKWRHRLGLLHQPRAAEPGVQKRRPGWRRQSTGAGATLDCGWGEQRHPRTAQRRKGRAACSCLGRERSQAKGVRHTIICDSEKAEHELRVLEWRRPRESDLHTSVLEARERVATSLKDYIVMITKLAWRELMQGVTDQTLLAWLANVAKTGSVIVELYIPGSDDL